MNNRPSDPLFDVDDVAPKPAHDGRLGTAHEPTKNDGEPKLASHSAASERAHALDAAACGVDPEETAIREQLTAKVLDENADAVSTAEAKLQAADQEKAQYDNAREDIKRDLDATPPMSPPAKPRYRLPDRAARWKATGIMLLFVAIVLVGWANLANYAVNSEQNWLVAALMASPLVIFPIALKDMVHPGSDAGNRWQYTTLAIVGLAAFAYYVFAFAQNYARQPSLEDILNNRIPPKDLRGQLVAQVILEMVVNVALLWGYNRLLVPAEKVLNPTWVLLHGVWESINRRIAATEVRTGKWRGRLIKIFAALEAAIQEALTSRRSRQADIRRKQGQ